MSGGDQPLFRLFLDRHAHVAQPGLLQRGGQVALVPIDQRVGRVTVDRFLGGDHLVAQLGLATPLDQGVKALGVAGDILREHETAAGRQKGGQNLTDFLKPVRLGTSKNVAPKDDIKAHVGLTPQGQQVTEFGRVANEHGRPLHFRQAGRGLPQRLARRDVGRQRPHAALRRAPHRLPRQQAATGIDVEDEMVALHAGHLEQLVAQAAQLTAAAVHGALQPGVFGPVGRAGG